MQKVKNAENFSSYPHTTKQVNKKREREQDIFGIVGNRKKKVQTRYETSSREQDKQNKKEEEKG